MERALQESFKKYENQQDESREVLLGDLDQSVRKAYAARDTYYRGLVAETMAPETNVDRANEVGSKVSEVAAALAKLEKMKKMVAEADAKKLAALREELSQLDSDINQIDDRSQ